LPNRLIDPSFRSSLLFFLGYLFHILADSSTKI
jgi:hypothetical protein